MFNQISQNQTITMDLSNVNISGTIPSGDYRVKLDIIDGGHTQAGYPPGICTVSKVSSAVWIELKITVVEGTHSGASFFHKIGVYSEKGERWREMGLETIAKIAYVNLGIIQGQVTQEDIAKLKTFQLSTINGTVCTVSVGVESSDGYEDKNVLNDIRIPKPGQSMPPPVQQPPIQQPPIQQPPIQQPPIQQPPVQQPPIQQPPVQQPPIQQPPVQQPPIQQPPVQQPPVQQPPVQQPPVQQPPASNYPENDNIPF